METSARTVAEQFVQALAARDRRAAEALYTSTALFEVHVPGWDTLAETPPLIGDLLQGFFIDRDDFRVARHQIIEHGACAALNFDLQWRDAHDGAPCVCFQSHHFEVNGNRIALQRMYCAGVRVMDAE